jgi:hypothetical protein
VLFFLPLADYLLSKNIHKSSDRVRRFESLALWLL